MRRIENKVAVVTGGARGIGRAICERLRDERGCTVIANYAGNDEAARKFTEETGIPTVKFDVGDYDAVQEACKKVEEEHGPIDIVVNNVGGSMPKDFMSTTAKEFSGAFHFNVTTAFVLSQAAVPHMQERGGSIVNISSSIGR